MRTDSIHHSISFFALYPNHFSITCLHTMTKLTIDQLSFHFNEHYAFIHVFEQIAKRYENNVFVHYPKQGGFGSLTYGQINQLATTVATQWAEEIKDVDTIAFIGDHSVNYLISQLAFLKLRIVLMCLSPRNSQPANVNLVQKTDAKLIYATEKYADMAKAVADESGNGCEAKVLPAFDIQELLQSPADGQALNHTFGPEDIEKTALIIHRQVPTSTCVMHEIMCSFLTLLRHIVPAQLIFPSRFV